MESKIGEDRKAFVRGWHMPTNTSGVSSFLGLMKCFLKFIKDFSKIASPMTNLTRKNGSVTKLDEKCDMAFEILKRLLSSAPIMKAPDWTRLFRFHTDACQLSVGGTLTKVGKSGE